MEAARHERRPTVSASAPAASAPMPLTKFSDPTTSCRCTTLRPSVEAMPRMAPLMTPMS
jgi:hypothetical protein